MESHFQAKGYALLKHLLDLPILSFLHDHALDVLHRGCMAKGDSQVPETPAAYGIPVMDTLLEVLLPKVENVSGLKLFPTYSYFRIYKRGDLLRKHKDRSACEISLSLCVSTKPEVPWPLWVESGGRPSAIPLRPGDGLLYRGPEVCHWREPFGGEQAIQVFLHYVNQDGPFRDWKYDRRSSLGKGPRT